MGRPGREESAVLVFAPLHAGADAVSLPPELPAIRESLPIFLQAYSKPDYKPDVALIYGTQVENTDLFPTTATFADDWNKSYAYPKLRYATFPDFFHYIEEHYGKELPTYKTTTEAPIGRMASEATLISLPRTAGIRIRRFRLKFFRP